MRLTVLVPQSGSNLIEEIIAAARIGRRKPAASKSLRKVEK